MTSTSGLQVPAAQALVADVPDGGDLTAALEWVSGQLPYRDGAVSGNLFGKGMGRMAWVRLERTRRFWKNEPLLLIQAMTSAASGLWHLGEPAALCACWCDSGLEVLLGAAPTGLQALSNLWEANLCGARLTPAGPPGDRPSAATHLWARPRPHAQLPASSAAPGEGGGPVATATLLDRLAALRSGPWDLRVLILPVPRNILSDRSTALARLSGQLATSVARQIQLDPETHCSLEDPVVRRLLDLVEDERHRCAVMAGAGGCLIAASLAAPSAVGLAAAVGAATGTAALGGHHWHNIGTRPDGPLPLSLLMPGEVADALCPPARDVLGLNCMQFVELDEHPEPAPGTGARSIQLGRTERGAPLHLPLDVLTGHLLVTGGSGAGKTSHVASLLLQLHQAGVPFWVVEPVKNEYQGLPADGLICWEPGATDPRVPWNLNPLEVPTGVSVSTHLDRLVALFRDALGLPDPLPHLVESALQICYEEAGWDLSSGRNLHADAGRDWPTLHQVLDAALELPTQLGYEPHIRGNLRAALMARMGGLLRGPRGRILTGADPFPAVEACSRPLSICLSSIGDDHARSFFMAMLLLRLLEARIADPHSSLVHVAVFEEAHRLLGREEGSRHPTDAADPIGHTARACGQLLSEIRATGEGIVVVDQSAGRLAREATVNTATKIALRSVDREDHRALGAALGLADDQERVLSGLGRHEALVLWEGMDGPLRADLQAHYLASRPPVVSNAAAPARLERPPAAVRTAVAALVRLTGAAADDAHRHLRRTVEAALPEASGAVIDEVVDGLVAEAVAALAGSRGWPGAVRRSATGAALSGADVPAHPAHLLAAGGEWPHLACAAACPGGGCLTGELLATEAENIVSEGPATLTRLAADPDERRRRLGRRVLAALPPSAPARLLAHAERCLTVQVFDEWAHPDTVAVLLPPDRGDP